MKKKIALLLTMVMCAALVGGCGTSEDVDTAAIGAGKEIAVDVLEKNDNPTEDMDKATIESTEEATVESTEEVVEEVVEEIQVGSTYESNDDGTHKVHTVYEDGGVEDLFAMACEYENGVCAYCGYDEPVVEIPDVPTNEPKATENPKVEAPKATETPKATEEPKPVETPKAETPASTPEPTPAPVVETPAPEPTPEPTPAPAPVQEEWVQVKDEWIKSSDTHEHIVGYQELNSLDYKEDKTSGSHEWYTGPILPRTAVDGTVTYAGTYICSVCGYDSGQADPSTFSTTAP